MDESRLDTKNRHSIRGQTNNVIERRLFSHPVRIPCLGIKEIKGMGTQLAGLSGKVFQTLGAVPVGLPITEARDEGEKSLIGDKALRFCIDYLRNMRSQRLRDWARTGTKNRGRQLRRRTVASGYRERRIDPFPVDIVRRADEPTTKINANQTQRFDAREYGLLKGRRGVLSRHIKEFAYFLRADLVGICEFPSYAAYTHSYPTGEPVELNHKCEIAVLVDQDRRTSWATSGSDWISNS